MADEVEDSSGKSAWWAGVVFSSLIAGLSGLYGGFLWMVYGELTRWLGLFVVCLIGILIMTKIARANDAIKQAEADRALEPQFDVDRIGELSNDELIQLAAATQTALRVRMNSLREQSETLASERIRFAVALDAQEELEQMLRPNG